MTQKNHMLFLLFMMLLALAVSGCTKTVTPSGPCNAPYFISEGETFDKSISDKESAYQILITIEPSWSKTSQYYTDYKNSKSNDVEYKEIAISGQGNTRKSVYVLKDHTAIDSDGQVYRKGGCI